MQSIIHLLESSRTEIQVLREQNKIMHARLQMFDDCMALLTSRQQEMGMSHTPDVVRDIDNYISDFNNPVVRRYPNPIPKSESVFMPPPPIYEGERAGCFVNKDEAIINSDRYQDDTNSGNGSGAKDEGFEGKVELPPLPELDQIPKFEIPGNAFENNDVKPHEYPVVDARQTARDLRMAINFKPEDHEF